MQAQTGPPRRQGDVVVFRKRQPNECIMRLLLTGLAIVFATLALDVTSSDAQFFSRRFCTFGVLNSEAAEPDCSFNTWEQCLATASGLGRYCGENPFYAGPSRGGTQSEKNVTRKRNTRSR